MPTGMPANALKLPVQPTGQMPVPSGRPVERDGQRSHAEHRAEGQLGEKRRFDERRRKERVQQANRRRPRQPGGPPLSANFLEQDEDRQEADEFAKPRPEKHQHAEHKAAHRACGRRSVRRQYKSKPEQMTSDTSA